ncbi:methyl-accepting chemotaxis protein [Pseudomonas sp. S32]|uniref:methyl-accepting chemotaxis protein n=1 Tax=Pseudomonas sp. S32 TaxID=2767448 RepID=UPI001912A5AD|nr:methyl-accepting chemotaxis protein [Pseudomonas sp. S32]MBK5006374.1 methyl-accepting chemotaxis protein [Pseudomonas sp. S32]
MYLRNLKIGIRATAIFAALALLVLILGLTSLNRMHTMDSATDEVRTSWLPAVMLLDEMSMNLGRARALALRSVLEDSPTARTETLDKIETINKQYETQLSDYEKSITEPTDRSLFETFSAASTTYHGLQNAIREAVRNNDLEEAKRLVNGSLADYADAMMKALIQLTHYNANGATHASEASSEAYEQSFAIIAVTIVIIISLMIALAILLTRSIVLPLAEAVNVAERVAAGELNQDIQVKGRDESALLLLSLSKMKDSLRETIASIAAASDQLASASEELFTVTEDTSRGLHQQSAEIDQAATAVNQMTAAVEEVASNAVNTADASKGADQSTRDGQQRVNEALQSIGHLVGDVTTTSQEIEHLASSANEISRVLDVIGSIAGQTNLLALNAAIEAARAGEAGRGFAVVADEVRALAHRTQQSTAEIEGMITGIQTGTESAVNAMHASKGRATGTLEVAQSAGQALDIIAEAISSINQRNLVIASASEEQAQVAREVDRNLVNIRDLAMQTSAGANQTSAAAQELSRLAVELNGMVGKFKV